MQGIRDTDAYQSVAAQANGNEKSHVPRWVPTFATHRQADRS